MKRSELRDGVEALIPTIGLSSEDTMSAAEMIVQFIEKYMTPNARPLTAKEIDEHPLVKQVHGSKKDEVRNYVANLDYEWKKTWEPEE